LTWSLASVLLVLGAIGGFASWTSRALRGSNAAAEEAAGQLWPRPVEEAE
jgi:hypothetical protein